MDNGVLVVLYVCAGHVERGKQEIAMLRAADARGYSPVALCFSPEDAAALVAADAARLVLAVDEDPTLTRLVEAAGGRVEALRAPPEPPHRGAGLNVSAVLRRLHQHGRTASQIAELLETTTDEIRVALHRLGYHPK